MGAERVSRRRRALHDQLEQQSQEQVELEQQIVTLRADHDRRAKQLLKVAQRLSAAGGQREATEILSRVRAARKARAVGRRTRSAPPVPAGWRPAPPDFVGVGAQRAGTTWWFGQLSAHPEVFSPRHKEVHYFDDLSPPLSTAEVAAYHDWFPRHEGGAIEEWPPCYIPDPNGVLRPARLSGEWTPRYMYDAFAPGMLATAAPNTKVLAIVRDPIERYRSGVSWSESRPRGTRDRLGASQSGWIEHGYYHQNLQNVLQHFPREQLLLLQYEACVADPDQALRRSYAFIGVEDVEFRPGTVADQVSVKYPRIELDPAFREALISVYAPGVAALARDFPEIDLDLWPNFAGLRTAPGTVTGAS